MIRTVSKVAAASFNSAHSLIAARGEIVIDELNLYYKLLVSVR